MSLCSVRIIQRLFRRILTVTVRQKLELGDLNSVDTYGKSVTVSTNIEQVALL